MPSKNYIASSILYGAQTMHNMLQNFVAEKTGRTKTMTLDQLKANGSGAYKRKLLTADDLNDSRFTATVGNRLNMSINDADLRSLHDMLSRVASGEYSEENILDNFNRFYKIWPDLEFPTSIISYVFITRPELNLYQTNGGSAEGKLLVPENEKDPRVRYMNADYPEILHMLTADYSTDHDFIPFLQGRTESLQIPDYEIATHDFMIPYFNYKMPYPGVANESLTGGQFDITFREDNRMRVFKMFDFWIYYIDSIMKDRLKASRQNIIKNEMEYMCSIYQFLCDPSSERILFWSKYTGCFPYAIPVSNLSHSLHNAVDNKVSVSFKYSYVEHMDPMILTDFSYNTKTDVRNRSGSEFVPVYDTDVGMTGTTLVGMPVIQRAPGTKDYVLKWYRREKGMSSELPSVAATLETYALNDAKDAESKEAERLKGLSAAYKGVKTGKSLKNNQTVVERKLNAGIR